MNKPGKLLWGESAQIIGIIVGILYLWGTTAKSGYYKGCDGVCIGQETQDFAHTVVLGGVSFFAAILTFPLVSIGFYIVIILLFVFVLRRRSKIVQLSTMLVLLILIQTPMIYLAGERGVQGFIEGAQGAFAGQDVIDGLAPVCVKYEEGGSGKQSAIAGFIAYSAGDYIGIQTREAFYSLPHRLIISVKELVLEDNEQQSGVNNSLHSFECLGD